MSLPTAPAQGQPVRIEHDARGTRVYGTAKSQSDVIGALKDQGFKWSRNQGFWYLNSTWKQPTRGVRIQALRYRRVDAFERVDEPGAERPAMVLAVLAGEALVRVVGAHMCGTSSGIS